MRIAIIGSRSLIVNVESYIPANITEIISGGALGIDSLAENWADKNNIPKLIIKPDYMKYGKSAPLRRNKLIVDAADLVVAVWDGRSRGTKYTIDYARKAGKAVRVHLIE